MNSSFDIPFLFATCTNVQVSPGEGLLARRPVAALTGTAPHLSTPKMRRLCTATADIRSFAITAGDQVDVLRRIPASEQPGRQQLTAIQVLQLKWIVATLTALQGMQPHRVSTAR